MAACAMLKYSPVLVPCDPKAQPVVIIGQVKNLVKVGYNGVRSKLEPRVGKDVSHFQ